MKLFASLPRRVRVVEVGPRDGLQNEQASVPVEEKVAFVENLLQAGVRDLEAGAFVSPRWVPQMADSFEVFRRLEKKIPADARLFALVPNEKGMRNALLAGCRHAAVFTAASETFSHKNTNASIDETFVRFREVARIAREEKIPLRGYVSTVFFCPYEGRVEPERAVDVTLRLLEEIGVFEVSLGDTIGAATPTDVERVLEKMLAKIPAEKLALHFHDTRGTALANVIAGLLLGITSFDASAGGLGGCPYAPSATGNLATEDLLFALHGMGIETGIDLDALARASRRLEGVVGRPLPSRVLSALRL